MAKAITRFEAIDGSVWPTLEKAEAHEALIRDVAEAMKPMGERPKGVDFTNGSGYVQHTVQAVASARRSLIALTRPRIQHWFDQQKRDHNTDFDMVHPSWFGRMLDGSATPLEDAWRRLCCVDPLNREWGQPYYATHPDHARRFCLNA